MTQQLEMFPQDQFQFLVKELQKTHDLTENVRRGLFARYNQLEKDVLELQEKLRDSLKPSQRDQQRAMSL